MAAAHPQLQRLQENPLARSFWTHCRPLGLCERGQLRLHHFQDSLEFGEFAFGVGLLEAHRIEMNSSLRFGLQCPRIGGFSTARMAHRLYLHWFCALHCRSGFTLSDVPNQPHKKRLLARLCAIEAPRPSIHCKVLAPVASCPRYYKASLTWRGSMLSLAWRGHQQKNWKFIMGLGSQAGTPHTPSHQCGSEGYCVGSGDLLIQGLFSTSMYAMPGINRHTHTHMYM